MLPMFRGSGARRIPFVSAKLIYSAATGSVPGGGGALAGDLLIAIGLPETSSGGGIRTGGSGGASLPSFPILDGKGRLYYRKLTNADLGSAVRGTSGSFAVFRGASSIVQVQTISGSGAGSSSTPVTAAGITRNSEHAGLLAFTVGRITRNSYTSAKMTESTGFALIPNLAMNITSGNNYGFKLESRLSPPNERYVNGTAFSMYWSFGSGDFEGDIYELRR